MKLLPGECHQASLDKSILVQVMAWCCQATCHYLSMSTNLYGVRYNRIINPDWSQIQGLLSKMYKSMFSFVTSDTSVSCMFWDGALFLPDWFWCTLLHLTYWSWHKMAANYLMTISSAFSWMKMYEFHLRFHWNLFLMFDLTIFHHWFR